MSILNKLAGILVEDEGAFTTRVRKVTVYGLGQSYATGYDAVAIWEIVPTRTQYGVSLDINVIDVKISWNLVNRQDNAHDTQPMSIQLGKEGWTMMDPDISKTGMFPIKLTPREIFVSLPKKKIKLIF
jgi:hypothetical protein